MAAIATGWIVAGVVTLLAVVVQTSAGMRLDAILMRSIGVGVALGYIVGGAVWWWR